MVPARRAGRSPRRRRTRARTSPAAARGPSRRSLTSSSFVPPVTWFPVRAAVTRCDAPGAGSVVTGSRREQACTYAHARDPSRPRQAARGGAGDVRRRRPALRPHQRRALAGHGPTLAARRDRRGRPAARRARARPRGRHRYVEPAVPRPGRRRGALRLLRRHAPRRQAAPPAPALRGRRRHPAAVRGRHLRRGHHLVRAAQHRRPRRRAGRDAPGDPTRRPAGRVRVQLADLGAVPHGLPRVPDAGAAAARAGRLLEPGRLRLPRRVDPRLARPDRPRGPDRGCRMAGREVAQPDRWGGRAAPRQRRERAVRPAARAPP